MHNLSDLKAFSEILKESKRVVVLSGAGISTSAGIPDFRTPGTGLYDNLAKYDLPYPEAIFDIDYFKTRPEPFYTLAKEMLPGQYKPTKTHHFIRLLSSKGILAKHFTQNIDMLERLAGIPEELIVEAHGSFYTSKCIGTEEDDGCGFACDLDTFKKMIDDPKCECGGLVKPDIVFFGENLPRHFFSSLSVLDSCDALIVLGTSLTVHPFASLISYVPSSTPRLLINMEEAGVGSNGFDFSTDRDHLFLGSCDQGVEHLVQLLDWKDEFLELVETEPLADTLNHTRDKEDDDQKTAETTDGQQDINDKTEEQELIDQLDKVQL